MLGRLRRSVIRESANIVYCSLIRTILEYCVSVRAPIDNRQLFASEGATLSGISQ